MAKGKHQKCKLYRLAQIKHYRVDKMLKIQMSEGRNRKLLCWRTIPWQALSLTGLEKM